MSQQIKEVRSSGKVPQYIDGQFVHSETSDWIELNNPASQETIAQVPVATVDEMERAVASAKEAQRSWRHQPTIRRVRYLMEYQALLKEHQVDIAKVLAEETGKTEGDAMGDVWRGIEVVEHACSLPTLMMGETTRNVATELDTCSYVHPLGVCAGITPFNFPAMIPLWMFPLAVGCGNSFVLKPSEQDPLTPLMLAELWEQTGIPKGLLQVVHGDKRQVDALLEHKDIKAVSFVGSVPVAEHVYRTGTDNLKRVQAFAGAKNHMIVMPDANKDNMVSSLVGSSCGACGQRCMAISVAVLVGEAGNWVDDIKQAMQNIRPGAPGDSDAAYGPLINRKSFERVRGIIANAANEGADVVLDGTDCQVESHPQGNWIGPTLFDNVTTDMEIYQQEIFGPALCVIHVDTLEEAIELVNANPYGNGTSIFTRSGAAARKYQYETEVGQVGINMPTPVPPPYFSFTGSKNSFFGDLHAYGKQAVRFYTETKTVMVRWPQEDMVEDMNLTIHMQE
ncbi:MAG TPA: CoA-acylating methylmalonate-semialdehyde dehydrogenase [Salinisphaeraceae bacterium]|nr:CoA-acylating methylmalonate-semialdehyde dehydrogenase [Salinisphaeraceae bacterium]